MNKRQHSRIPSDRPLLPFMFAKATSPDQRRPERNEDYLLTDRESGLAVICDGVGCVSEAGQAARIAARTVRTRWRHMLTQYTATSSHAIASVPDLADVLRQLLEEANQAVLALEKCMTKKQQEQSEKKEGAETTIALAVFYPHGNGYLMAHAHVGDSRIYLLRKDTALQRLTVDDGYFTWMMKKGEMSEQDAWRIDQASSVDQLSKTDRKHFDRRNSISQSLGDASVTVHVDQLELCPGDRILLCTDGIHDNLTDAEIEEVLRASARTIGAKALVKRAIARAQQDKTVFIRAKKDDMSAVVVAYRFSSKNE